MKVVKRWNTETGLSPIREALGKYESWWSITYSNDPNFRARGRFRSRVLNEFLARTRHTRPEEFSKTEILDYLGDLQKRHNHGKPIRLRLSVVQDFFNWMYDTNPPLVFKRITDIKVPIVKSKKRQLTHEEFWRLRAECYRPELVEAMALVLEGRKQKEAAALVGISYTTLYTEFKHASRRAALPGITLTSLRRLGVKVACDNLAEQLRLESPL